MYIGDHKEVLVVHLFSFFSFDFNPDVNLPFSIAATESSLVISYEKKISGTGNDGKGAVMERNDWQILC